MNKDSLKDETIMSIIKFCQQFDVDLEPTGKDKYEKNKYYAKQYKISGSNFFGTKFNVLDIKLSLWFINKKTNKFNECIINLIIDDKIYNNDCEVRVKFRNNRWLFES